MAQLILGLIIGAVVWNCFLVWLYNHPNIKAKTRELWGSLTKNFGEKEPIVYQMPREHFPKVYNSKHELLDL